MNDWIPYMSTHTYPYRCHVLYIILCCLHCFVCLPVCACLSALSLSVCLSGSLSAVCVRLSAVWVPFFYEGGGPTPSLVKTPYPPTPLVPQIKEETPYPPTLENSIFLARIFRPWGGIFLHLGLFFGSPTFKSDRPTYPPRKKTEPSSQQRHSSQRWKWFHHTR